MATEDNKDQEQQDQQQAPSDAINPDYSINHQKHETDPLFVDVSKHENGYDSLNVTEHERKMDELYSESSNLLIKHIPEDLMKEQRTSSTRATINNILKLYIGFAIMSFPRTFIDSGFIGSVIAILGGLAINMFSVYLLVKARNHYKRENILSLSDLVVVCFGEQWKIWIDIVIVTTQAFFIMIYFIYLGEQTSILWQGDTEQSTHIGFLFAVVIMPLVSIKMLKDVSYFSAFANVTSILVVTIVFGLQIQTYCQQNEIDFDTFSVYPGTYTQEELDTQFDYLWYGKFYVPLTFSYTMTVFEGNAAILNYYSQAQDPSQFIKIIWWIMIFVTGVAVALGVTGYMAYGNLTADSILFNLELDTNLSITIQIFYLLVITGSLIVQFMPITQVFEQTAWYKRYSVWPCPCRFLLRFLLIQSIFWISACIPSINVAADFVGATLAPIVSIIVPAACYMKAYGDETEDSDKPNERKWLFNYIYMFLAIGITFGIVGLSLIIYDLCKDD